jgi:hypothetical protein
LPFSEAFEEGGVVFGEGAAPGAVVVEGFGVGVFAWEGLDVMLLRAVAWVELDSVRRGTRKCSLKSGRGVGQWTIGAR